MQKPFVITFNETKTKVINFVNELYRKDGVPFYILDGIFEDALREIKQQAVAELNRATKEYNASQLEGEQLTLEEAAQSAE